MTLSQEPVTPTDAASSSPAESPAGFREWSHKAGDGPSDASRDDAPFVSMADLRHPYVKVAAAAFIGYTLAKLIHRRG